MPENREPTDGILWRLGNNLRRLRSARGYTQLELGRRCGLTRSYISNIEQETANISLANLEALAVGLKCSEYDLLKPVKRAMSSPAGR